ncbi:Uncharacterized protein HZ326_14459 [Fusarium oxysporum f. sp. albedinis]|nr:Uncharacterized protein HZ326_14459 [Fusarium oxysporum f. sp. albedinis]
MTVTVDHQPVMPSSSASASASGPGLGSVNSGTAMEGLKKPDFSGCHSRLVWRCQRSHSPASHSPAPARTSTARIHSFPPAPLLGSLFVDPLPLLPYPHLNEPSSSKSRLSLLLSSASTEFLLRLHTPTTQTTFYHKHPS